MVPFVSEPTPRREIVEPDLERYPVTPTVSAAASIAARFIDPFWGLHPGGRVSFRIRHGTMSRDEAVAVIVRFESPEEQEDPVVNRLILFYSPRRALEGESYEWEVTDLTYPGGEGERRAYRVEPGPGGTFVRQGPVLARYVGVPEDETPTPEYEF